MHRIAIPATAQEETFVGQISKGAIQSDHIKIETPAQLAYRQRTFRHK